MTNVFIFWVMCCMYWMYESIEKSTSIIIIVLESVSSVIMYSVIIMNFFFNTMFTYKCGNLTTYWVSHIGYTTVSKYDSTTMMTQRKTKIVRSLNVEKFVERMS